MLILTPVYENKQGFVFLQIGERRRHPVIFANNRQTLMKIKLIKIEALLFIYCFMAISYSFGQTVKPFMTQQRQFGFINQKQEIVFPANYDRLDYNEHGFLIRNKAKKYGLLNTKGKFVVQCYYEAIENWKETNLVLIEQNNLWGIANPTTGQIVLKPQFTRIQNVKHGQALVDSTYYFRGIVKANGEMLVKPRYRYLGQLNNGLRLAKNQQGKYGYLDKAGKTAIEFMYTDAQPFENGQALVTPKDHTTWMSIDTKGNKIASAKWPPPIEEKEDEPILIRDYVTVFAEPVVSDSNGIKQYPERKLKAGGILLRLKDQKTYSKQLLQLYFKNNIRFPRKAKRKKVQAKVKIQFMITTGGELSWLKVMNDVGYGCSKEAIRLLRAVPQWKPAQYGRAIASLNTVEILFDYTSIKK